MRRRDSRRHAVIVGTIIEAFDAADPTRSHEHLPSWRLRHDHHSRRFMRQLVRTAAAVAFLAGVVTACN